MKDITEQKEIEEKIKIRQDFERLLLDISRSFINIPFNEVDESIDIGLKDICEFTNSYSAHIFKIDENLENINLSHFYSSNTSDINLATVKTIAISANSEDFQNLLQNKVLQFSSINRLPDNSQIKTRYKNTKVESLIDIALFYQNKLHGFLGLTSTEANKNWGEDEVKLLQVMGDLFMNAIQRHEFMLELLDSEQNYREIYNATGEAIFILNAITGEIEDVNDAMLKMYNIEYNHIIGEKINYIIVDSEEYIQDDPLDLIHHSLEKPLVFEWLAKKHTGETFWTEVSLKKGEINGLMKKAKYNSMTRIVLPN